jgi:micrococcal nuclease
MWQAKKLIGLGLLVVAASSRLFGTGDELVGEVIGITDGDTIRVLVDGEKNLRVRLHGIDAPEKGQPYAAKAKEFVGDECFKKRVTLKLHGKDRYGRLLAEVVLPDGHTLNHRIVTAGFAWWFRRYAANDEQLRELEEAARKAKRGLWADPDPVPPWEWRSRTLVRMSADPKP